MSSMMGNKVKISIFGQSHSEGLGVVIDGLPAGEQIDLDELNTFLQRRAGGKNIWSTARKEHDEPKILSGLIGGITCGAPICAVFENTDIKSKDYDTLADIPRPSHADYAANVKYGGFEDKRGGGHFSGRLTLPLCFAGAVCLQLLERQGIKINAYIHSIGNETDEKDMTDLMERTASDGDSIGGIIECTATGIPAGIGNPMFDTLESRLSYTLFAIPAIKGVEFGTGFAGVSLTGSEYNDAFYFDGDTVKTKTNHCGGIQGGISNGMPIVFRVVVKPTPSIFKQQDSINLKTKESVTLTIQGRHDPCIVPRAVPCVEAVCAIVLYDIIIGG